MKLQMKRDALAKRNRQASESGQGFGHSQRPIRVGFRHSSGTVEAKEGRKRWDANRSTHLESAGGLVVAGQFERPTPCAQGSIRHASETACFQVPRFQGDGANLLLHVRSVAWCSVRQTRFRDTWSKRHDVESRTGRLLPAPGKLKLTSKLAPAEFWRTTTGVLANHTSTRGEINGKADHDRVLANHRLD
jgi:hypothetical protein